MFEQLWQSSMLNNHSIEIINLPLEVRQANDEDCSYRINENQEYSIQLCLL